MGESCRLSIKLAPGSSTDAVQGWLGDALKLRVTAPPERGSLRIVAGAASARKVVEIDGLSEAEVRRRLGRAPAR